MHQNRFRLGLRARLRWGSLRRFPKPTSRLGGDRRLGRVHSRARLRHSPRFAVPSLCPWRRLCLRLLCKLHKFGQLILTIIIKIDATRCQILRLKCTKIVLGWGSATDPAGGAYSAPPDPLAGLKGAYVKGRGCGKGWEGEEREEKRGERDGNGGHPQYFIAPPFQFSRNMPCTNGYRITCPSKERHYHPFPMFVVCFLF